MEYSELLAQMLGKIGDISHVDNSQLLLTAREMGLGENELAELKNAFSLIDRISEQTSALDTYRKQTGGTRIEFVGKELDRITADMKEDEKRIVIESYLKAEEQAGDKIMEEE